MPPEGFDPTLARKAAEEYERFFVPAIGAPMAADLVGQAGLGSGDRVLDVACGTGIAARLAAREVGPEGHVTGLDPNPAMLAVARASAPAGADITWCEGPAEAIPLPEASFDAALCAMGLQFFSDRTRGLREIRRVLEEGGRLVANVPGPIPEVLEILEDVLATHVGAESAVFVRTVFSLHDDREIRKLAADAGFREVEVRSARKTLRLPDPESFLWGYVRSTPLAAAVAAMDEEGRAALGADYRDRCGPYVEAGALTDSLTMSTLLGRA